MGKPTTGKGKNSLIFYEWSCICRNESDIICICEYIFASISGDKMPKADGNKPKTPMGQKGKNVLAVYDWNHIWDFLKLPSVVYITVT